MLLADGMVSVHNSNVMFLLHQCLAPLNRRLAQYMQLVPCVMNLDLWKLES
jgi:hypothetical protein